MTYEKTIIQDIISSRGVEANTSELLDDFEECVFVTTCTVMPSNLQLYNTVLTVGKGLMVFYLYLFSEI